MHQTWSNDQSQHYILYGGVSLSISLNLKLAPVPYTTPKWPIMPLEPLSDVSYRDDTWYELVMVSLSLTITKLQQISSLMVVINSYKIILY